MSAPLVSVLIPFKNTAPFLRECLNSILEQTYKNWEIIAVNDNSVDNSLQILAEYARTNARIKVVTNTEDGIITALRLAYSLSNGECITRMDSDDIMKPQKLKAMVHDLRKNGTGHVAIGQVTYFSEKGISNGYARYEKWLNKLTTIGSNYTEIYKECVVPSPCWMVYREDFDACEAFKPNRYPEDYDLTFRFYEKGLKIIPCSQVLLLWRDYDSRTSRTSEHYAHNYFLDIKLHYFIKLHLDLSSKLLVWGAGNKGKTIAKLLISKNIAFDWICDNPKKIGKEIYGKVLQHFEYAANLEKTQCIITVANEEEQQKIRSFLSGHRKQNMQDYFFFC